MKHLTPFIFLFWCLVSYAEDTITVPPLSVPETASQGVAPGDWRAVPESLDYAETEKSAREMEEAGNVAEALTLWERVLDRTTTTEENRVEARRHVQELRPQVAINTDPEAAKKWHVLVLVYKEVKTASVHQTFTETDFAQIGKSLGGFRDFVFLWSSGIVLPEFDFVFIDEPITTVRQRGFPVSIRDVAPEFKKASESAEKTYGTVIAYVKFRGDDGPTLARPWTAAIYGRLAELDYAGYMMVPWGPDYPYPGEPAGEMELHEWLHQADDVVHVTLGYPRGTSRSSDDGRTVNDSRTDGEQEYKRPRGCTTWTLFYKHLMTEHMTRQIWSEMTISQEAQPGAVIEIQ